MVFIIGIEFNLDSIGLKLQLIFLYINSLSAERHLKDYRKKETPEGIDIMNIKKLAVFSGKSVEYFVYDNDVDDINTECEDYKYINTNMIKSSIDIEQFVSECVSILNQKNIELNSTQVNDKKKYITDSLEIGFSILKRSS